MGWKKLEPHKYWKEEHRPKVLDLRVTELKPRIFKVVFMEIDELGHYIFVHSTTFSLDEQIKKNPYKWEFQLKKEYPNIPDNEYDYFLAATIAYFEDIGETWSFANWQEKELIERWELELANTEYIDQSN